MVAIMKSRNDQVDKVVEKIEAMHSYDQPAVVIIPIEKTNKSFTNWVNNVIDVSSIGV
jgi:periplasmic divalent cation tolerance protein